MPLIHNLTLARGDHAHKEHRNTLKAEYYTKIQEHASSEPPPDVNFGQWVEM